VPDPAIAADFHQPFDIQADVPSQVAFHAVFRVDDFADLAGVVFGKIAHARIRVDARFFQDLARSPAPDPIDIG